MSLSRALAGTALIVSLSGCALFHPPTPGESADQVVSTLGKPSYIWDTPEDTIYEYSAGSMGQYTYMARFKNHRLISYEQVWTLQHFHQIIPKQSTEQDVLNIVGHPTEVRHYANTSDTAWNYGFKESNVWNSMMTVFINEQGIVTRLENGPDPRFERNDGLFPYMR